MFETMENEKREIRKMINKFIPKRINENFATKRSNEEFDDYVTYVTKEDSGLSKDIIIDCGENYKYYNHPLCIYVVEDDNFSVYPVIVSSTPRAPFGNSVPPDIIAFVQNSVEILKGIADVTMSGGEFFDYLDAYQERQKTQNLVGEMSNLSPQETGLPIWIYVDDTQSFNIKARSPLPLGGG